MPIVDLKSSLMLSDVIATELSELPIVWEMWNYNNKFKGIEYINGTVFFVGAASIDRNITLQNI